MIEAKTGTKPKRINISTSTSYGEKVNRMYVNLRNGVSIEVNYDKEKKCFNVFQFAGVNIAYSLMYLENPWVVQKIVAALVQEYTGTERRIQVVGKLNRP